MKAAKLRFILALVGLLSGANVLLAQFTSIQRNPYTTNDYANGWKALQEYTQAGQWVSLSQSGTKWRIAVNLTDPLTNGYTANVVLKGASNHITGNLTVAGTLYVGGSYNGPNTIPLASLQVSGTPGSSTVLFGDATWKPLPVYYVDTENSTLLTVTTNGTTYTVGVGVNLARRDVNNTFLKTNSFLDEVWLGKDVYGTTNGTTIHWAIKKNGSAYVFYGDGSGLTNLDAAAVVNGQLSDSVIPANIARLNLNQAFTGENRFLNLVEISNNHLFGTQSGVTKWRIQPDGLAFLNGAGVTNLNASELRTGTVPVARLPSNVALTDAANTFTANQTVNGTLTATTFVGSGSGLTNIPVSGIAATGTRDGTTALFGDGTWKAVPTVLYTGSGSPEGVVTASPPAMYYSSTGGLWVKASGTGATGWVALIAP